MRTVSLDEQETSFTIEAVDRGSVYVFSNDTVWQRRIERLGITHYREDGYGRFYKVSLEDFNFGFRKKRQLSDEQRRDMSERMRNMHQ